MSDHEQEIKKLQEENRTLKEREHQSHGKLKLAIFGAALVVIYMVEPHSQLLAGAIGAAAFYFCFMRHG